MRDNRVTRGWRLGLVLVAVFISLPILFSGFVDDQKRANIERRQLAEAPEISELLSDPRKWFSSATNYLNDQAAGVILSSRIMAWTKNYVFKDSPTQLMHRTKDGFLILHTFNPERPFQAASICYSRFMERQVSQLKNDVQAIATGLGEKGIDARFFIAPSSFALYSDRFSRAAQTAPARACRRLIDKNTLMTITDLDVVVHYPFQEFVNRRQDPSFYPAGNFHWQGESVHEGIMSWVEKQPESPLTDVDERYDLQRVKMDVASIVGFERYIDGKVYGYNKHQSAPIDLPVPIKKNILRRQNPKAYRTRVPVFDKRVLILSNSFGIEGHLHLSPLYRDSVWMNINGLSKDELTYILFDWSLEYAPDQVIFLFHDYAAAGRIHNIARAL